MGFYLVTGGAGFIGSHLVDRLIADGHSVRVLDDFSTGHERNLPAGVELVRGSVVDAEAVRRAMEGAEGCFHLAAIASVARCNEDWLASHRVNQGGSVAVMECAARAGCVPVVYASSAAVYGDIGDAVAAETIAPSPRTAYGADKLGSELHGRVAWDIHRVPTLGVRFFNVYGDRQDAASPYSGVIALFARCLAEGPSVAIFGDGGQSRDFVHVGDAVNHMVVGMARLHRTPDAVVANVCTGRSTTILELATAVAAIFRREAAPTFLPARAGDIRRSLGDPARARALLGVEAATTLDAGLAFLRGPR